MSHSASPAARTLLALALALASCGRASGPSAPAASFTDAGMKVELSVASGALREGKNELRLRVVDAASGAPVDDASLSLDYAMSMAGTPPMKGSATAAPLGGGEYRAEADLRMAGTWQLALSARRASGQEARATGSLRTGAAEIQIAASPSPAGADEISHYTCSMHPSVHESHPGKCPICGMDLVPVTRGQAANGVVRVEPERLQKIGVRFAQVERAPLVRTVRALGRVTWDETRLVDVAPKISGFVRDLRADALGARVAKGEPLFSLYSPDLYAAEAEYLQARSSGSERLASAGRARLRLWDVAERDVAALEASGKPLETLPVRAPASGYLVEKNVVEGGAFEAGQRLFRIAPLERIWVEAEVYASDLALVGVGTLATVSAPYLPGRTLQAKVAYVLPSLASETRTARVRLELENGDLALRPEMFVDVELHADLGPRVLVPTSAVIVSGDRRVVFVERAPGELEPRSVETGVTGEDVIEVTSGLQPGERVVASGNFLIAAESRVQSLLEQW